MQRFPFPATSRAFSLLLVGALALCSCGDGSSPNMPPGVPPDRDFVALSVGGVAEIMHAEGSGAPSIACDPRVDWFASQVVLYENYTGGTGPSGYDFFFGILFPTVDAVGTYSVHGDNLQAFLDIGTRYVAGPLAAASDGTVVVTRSDDRIEGTFTITVVDSAQTSALTLTGRFGVDSGYSTSCP